MKNKGFFIVWKKPHGRGKEMAKHLGVKLMFLDLKYSAIIRYPLFFFYTFFFLLLHKPSVIIVQTPPIFAVLSVYIYTLLYGGRYAVDSHTGELVEKKWKKFDRLRRFLFARATVVFVHNSYNLNLVKGWKGRYLILTDDIPPTPEGKKVTTLCKHKKSALFITGTVNTEPIYEVLSAARLLEKEGWIFFLSGHPSNYKGHTLPKNTILTGYLPYEEYLQLVKCVKVVITFDTREGVITRGTWESIGAGTPFVTNDSSTLKEMFGNIAVYTKINPEAIAYAIKTAYSNRKTLQKRILQKRIELNRQWEKNLEAAKNLLGL